MKNKKEIKTISIGRIIFSHLILWTIVHTILSLFTLGIWLLIGLPLQALDLWNSCNKRAKFAEAQRQEMLQAIRQGNSSL